MKFILFTISIILISLKGNSQTLVNYINEAKKNFSPPLKSTSTFNTKNTTSLQFGYFVNPQYTISGAQRAYAEVQQEIPWLGKSNYYRKVKKNSETQLKLEQQYQIEQLGFLVKESYYKMYQFKKQKDIYVTWAEKIRTFIYAAKETDSITTEIALQQFEHETKLIEVTKQLQIIDGHYQNEVITFNELLKNENLDEPTLPILLAMPEEESEFQFPDPLESASYLSFENKILGQKIVNSVQNPWTPNISFGLRYKKKPKLTEDKTNKLLDHKLSILSHQLQTAINNQISARIAYDASEKKLDKLTKLEKQLNSSKIKIPNEKILQINSLKYTFEVEQIKAVADYYISTSKMLLFF